MEAINVYPLLYVVEWSVSLLRAEGLDNYYKGQMLMLKFWVGVWFPWHCDWGFHGQHQNRPGGHREPHDRPILGAPVESGD
ncbi:hypothetical protein SUGI_0068840 [Cryptomeria japonica]|nr:hypothetical protein SUGI_0068840 [Cryptomeria japonica]